jgi:hypothetical protein
MMFDDWLELGPCLGGEKRLVVHLGKRSIKEKENNKKTEKVLIFTDRSVCWWAQRKVDWRFKASPFVRSFDEKSTYGTGKTRRRDVHLKGPMPIVAQETAVQKLVSI